jgi:hypothetical protein
MTQSETDGLLYHYTSAAGFTGILSKRCFWASSIYYLNDSREFHHARDLYRKMAAELLERETDAEVRANWSERLEVLSRDIPPGRVHPFILSLSAKGDLLSQWRAYGAGTGGFAIGLRPDVLCGILPRGFELRQCIYCEKEQENRVRQSVLATRPSPGETNPLTGEKRPFKWVASTVRLYADYVHRYATIFKDRAFEEEAEWRCISPWAKHEKHGWPEDEPAPKLHVRPGHSMLIPYVEIHVPEQTMDSLIARVRLGPTPHPALAIRSTRAFLKEHGLAAEVVESSVPFRAW